MRWHRELPTELISSAAQMFGGRDKGFSGPELYDIFSRYTDELGPYPWEGGAPSRWRIIELGLYHLSTEDQVEVLKEMRDWAGPMKYGRPSDTELEWLDRKLAALPTSSAIGDARTTSSRTGLELLDDHGELSEEAIRRISEMFGGRTGFSGREIYDFFHKFTDELGSHPGSGAPSRWQIVEAGLSVLPVEEQLEALEAMIDWPGSMYHGPPPSQDIEWLRSALSEARASLGTQGQTRGVPRRAEAERASSLWLSGWHDVPTEELVGIAEGPELEYKQSARVNLHTQKIDPKIELAWIRGIAGLWNAHGGVLIIGVEDRTFEVTGLALDLGRGGLKDEDSFRNWMTGKLCDHLGSEVPALMSVQLDEVDAETICRIDVPEGPEPLFVDDRHLVVRMDNSTRELVGSPMLRYIRQRWPAS